VYIEKNWNFLIRLFPGTKTLLRYADFGNFIHLHMNMDTDRGLDRDTDRDADRNRETDRVTDTETGRYNHGQGFLRKRDNSKKIT
jgi:hypothetical protein